MKASCLTPQDAAAHDREMEDDPKDGDEGARARSRLVWTPELHERFMNAVNHLGVKHAVPKTILQLMNVEGLTRENVASHLQVATAAAAWLLACPCSAHQHSLVPDLSLPQPHKASAPADECRRRVHGRLFAGFAASWHSAYC